MKTSDDFRTLTHQENLLYAKDIQALREEMVNAGCTSKRFIEQLKEFQKLDLTPYQKTIMRRGLKARQEMFLGNQKLVQKFAHRMKNRSLPLDDLIQFGNEALFRAIENFDPTKGWRLSTFAWWWIRSEMAKQCSKNDTQLTISLDHTRKIHKINKAHQELQSANQKEPTTKQLANHLNMPEKEIEKTLTNHYQTVSLNIDDTDEAGEINQEDSLVGDIDPLENVEKFEDILEDRQFLSDLLNRLPHEVKEIFEEYYLEEIPKKEVAKRHRISQHKLNAILQEHLELLNLVVSS